MNYLDTIRREVDPLIDELLQHTVIRSIEAGTLTRNELVVFAEQYYVYCSYFPRYLAAVAANTPDDATRENLVENLWEEHGEGDLSKSHRQLFIRFIHALGDQREPSQLEGCIATREYVERTLRECQSVPFLQGLGMLGPGAEMFTGRQYEKILRGLKTYSFILPEALEFWIAHIDLDDGHYEHMAAATEAAISGESDAELVRRGAFSAIKSEMGFWDIVGEEIGLTDG